MPGSLLRRVLPCLASLACALAAEPGDGEARMRSHADAESLLFSPDGRTLASLERWKVHLWDVATGRERVKLEGMGGYVPFGTMHFSPDGGTISWAGYSWNAATGALVRRLPIQTDNLSEIAAAAPDRDLMASASGSVISLFEERSRARDLHGHTKEVVRLAYSPDGSTLASASVDGTLRLWDIEAVMGCPGCPERPRVGSIKTWRTLLYRTGLYVGPLGFSPDGSRVAVHGAALTAAQMSLVDAGRGGGPGHEPGVVHVFDTRSGRAILRWRADRDSSPAALSFSPDGAFLLLSGGATVLVRIGDGREVFRVGPMPAVPAIFSPDGKAVALVTTEALSVVDAGAGHPRFSHPNESFRGLAFSPDSRILATCSNRAIQLWDASTGAEVPPRD